MGGRLDAELLERVEQFCDRVMSVAEALYDQHRTRRPVDQMAASGSSVGANAFEAAEALSRPDFCKCLGIMIKEMNETRFWLRLAIRRGWLPKTRVEPLLREADELKSVFGAMLTRTRAKDGR